MAKHKAAGRTRRPPDGIAADPRSSQVPAFPVSCGKAGAGAVILGLLIGILSITVAYKFVSAIGAPTVHLQLVPDRVDGVRRLSLRFLNTGRQDVRLDFAGSAIFVRPPPDQFTAYTVHMRTGAERERRNGTPETVVLGPRQYTDVPVPVDAFPAEEIVVAAVYESGPADNQRPDAWQGLVRSFPVILAATR